MQKNTVVVFGQSGFGKSSFINYVLQSNVAQTGMARSITRKITPYNVSKGFMNRYTLIDTIGLEDTEGESNKEIFQGLKNKVQEMFFRQGQVVHRLKLIFLLSLSESRINLVPLKTLISYFGPQIISSTVILLTKVDKVHPTQFTPKIEALKMDLVALKKKMGPYQPMPPFVYWNNKNHLPAQEASLTAALQKLYFYTPQNLQNITSQIQKESDRLYGQIKKTTKVVKHRKERRSRTNWVTKYRTEEFFKEVPETITEFYQKPVHHQRDNYFLFFYTGTSHWTTYESATREKTIIRRIRETKQVPYKESYISYYFEDVPYYEEQSLPASELYQLRLKADKDAFRIVSRKYCY